MRLLACFALGAAAWAQSASRIEMDYSFHGAVPSEYHISVDNSGAATFEEPATENQDAYKSEFQASPRKTKWLFANAEQANRFRGDFEYTKHKIADTGEKRLTFIEGEEKNTAAFHYSDNATIQQLTAWFQGVALTQEFARKAKFDLRFDKLALDNDMKVFAAAVESGQATEVQSIRPLLEQLANDPSVLKTVRLRANALLTRRENKS